MLKGNIYISLVSSRKLYDTKSLWKNLSIDIVQCRMLEYKMVTGNVSKTQQSNQSKNSSKPTTLRENSTTEDGLQLASKQ